MRVQNFTLVDGKDMKHKMATNLKLFNCNQNCSIKDT